MNAQATAEAQPAMTNSHNQGAEREVTFKDWIAVVGSALGAFMAVLDIQITASSLKDIQGALGASLDEGSWISTAYLIAEIVTIPLTGWLSKVFGLKRYILTNAVLFLIFSMCCGLAWDLNSLIAFRAAQGFTGGVLIPMSFAIILSKLPPSKQPIGLAIFSITAVFAPSIGPTIGGYLTDNFGWEYSFYLNLIPGIALISMLAYSLRKAKMQLDLLKRGDYLGITTMAIGLSCLIYVLEEGQRKDWFGSELISRSAIVAAITLTIFVISQFVKREPLLNLKLLFQRNFGIGSFANTVFGMALYGSVFIIPSYLTIVQGYSALQIGQVLIWSGLPQLAITPFIPLLMKKVDARIMLVVGLALFSASCFMNAFMSHDYSGPQLIAAMLVRSLGQPLIMVPLSTLTTAGIAQEEAPTASSLFNMMRNLGGSFGIAGLSTILTQREQFHSERIGESFTAVGLNTQQFLSQAMEKFQQHGYSQYSAHQAAIEQLAHRIKVEAYVQSFNDCFLALGIVLLTAAIVAMFLKKADPNAHSMAE